MDKRVEKILEMMRDDVRGELSLAEFAQSVNLSVWRLCHIFKSDVGIPPIKYLRLLRMERAKGLLESSFLSVKEIAFQVGLNDESHFVRDFKATYGHSPAIYRSQFKRNGNGNGNGNNNGNGNSGGNGTASGMDQPHNSSSQPHSSQPGKLGRHVTHAAKQSILPMLQLFLYVVYCF